MYCGFATKSDHLTATLTLSMQIGHSRGSSAAPSPILNRIPTCSRLKIKMKNITTKQGSRKYFSIWRYIQAHPVTFHSFTPSQFTFRTGRLSMVASATPRYLLSLPPMPLDPPPPPPKSLPPPPMLCIASSVLRKFCIWRWYSAPVISSSSSCCCCCWKNPPPHPLEPS